MIARCILAASTLEGGKTAAKSVMVAVAAHREENLLVLISKDGDHRSLPPGRYACELIKEDGGQWRFSRRTVFHDHDYTLDGIARETRGASGGPSQPPSVPPARSS